MLAVAIYWRLVASEGRWHRGKYARPPRNQFRRVGFLLCCFRVLSYVPGGGSRQGRLAQLREMYEPYVNGLADRLLMPLPPWLPTESVDNWRTSAWERISAGPLSLPEPDEDRHF